MREEKKKADREGFLSSGKTIDGQRRKKDPALRRYGTRPSAVEKNETDRTGGDTKGEGKQNDEKKNRCRYGARETGENWKMGRDKVRSNNDKLFMV